MAQQTPDKEHVDHAEVARRERRSNKAVGPLSRFGGPITIAGLAVAIVALIYAIVASGIML